MIQLAVFDMAGTTVRDRDNVHQALIDAMGAFGFAVERPEANEVMGYPKPQAIRAMLERRGADVALVEPVHRTFLDNMIRFYQTDPEVAPTHHAEETFAELRRRGIRVALNTGFSRDITETIIARLGWHDKLDAWVASDMVEHGRPYPDMIRYLMQQTGVTDPAAVAKIGDTTVDILEGRHAGAGLIVSITSGAYQAEELAALNPTHLVATLEDALPILLGQPRTE